MSQSLGIILLFQFILHPAIYAIKVVNNQFVDDSGNKIQLRGVSHSGSEYSCVHKTGIMEGGVDDAAVKAIKAWGNNVVRIPLNEDCWLAINGVPSQYAGDNYKKAITSYVNFITQNGMIAILDLHWTASGGTMATKQDPMPDLSHSPQMWSSVASAFKDNKNVIFELFNEPFPGNGNVGDNEWKCWASGACTGGMGVNYQAAGMDKLISAIRATGAENVIVLGALVWSNHMDGWLNHVPTDPKNNMGAVWHSYDFNACVSQSCWESTVAPIAAKFPVIVTESGFKIDYVKKLWPWLKSQGISYMAWTWNTWGGNEGLISDYSGTATNPWGQTWKDHLASYNTTWYNATI